MHGRPEHLYSQAISVGKARLEQLTSVSKVRYGDYPDRRTKYLSAITMVSGITDFSRLDQMRKRVQELNGTLPFNNRVSDESLLESVAV